MLSCKSHGRELNYPPVFPHSSLNVTCLLRVVAELQWKEQILAVLHRPTPVEAINGGNMAAI